MNIPARLAKFLKKHKVDYEIVDHPAAFTSCETAEAGHIAGSKLAKVVMARAGGRDVMLVLPSTRTVDLLKLSAFLDTGAVRIEVEKEFEDLFPNCEPGAMPPFGNLYHLPCYVDISLTDEGTLFFNAGSHNRCIHLATDDFLRISKAKIGDFSVPGKKFAARRAAI